MRDLLIVGGLLEFLEREIGDQHGWRRRAEIVLGAVLQLVGSRGTRVAADTAFAIEEQRAAILGRTFDRSEGDRAARLELSCHPPTDEDAQKEGETGDRD